MKKQAIECPFCGVKPVIEKMKVKTYQNGDTYQDYKVKCKAGNCFVSPSVTGHDEAQAIFKWNQRPEHMKKRTRIVMLPTDKVENGIYRENINQKLSVRSAQFGRINVNTHKPQHLYFISGEILKSEGWGIHSETNELFQYEEAFYNPWVYKIIATTAVLKIKEVDSFEFGSPQDEYYVPQIPQSFIEEYCRKGGIDEVEVEYNEIYMGNLEFELKVDSNNCIIIHPIKDSWNREEVEKLCEKAFSCGVRLWEDWEKEDVEMWEKFKKLNLKDKDKALHIGGVSSSGFVSATCKGEKCYVCGENATNKLGEEIPYDDPNPNRHNLTAYVCREHFRMIVGILG